MVEGRRTFGAAADAAAGDRLCPIVGDRVADFGLLEELWRHVLGTELGLMEPWGDVHVLLVVPPSWGRPALAECMRIFFERFGVAGLYIGEAPVLAALGCAQASAVVLDFGHGGTEVSLVWDGHLVRSAAERFPVGGADVDRFIAAQLAGDAELQPPAGADPEAVARALKETAVAEGGRLAFAFQGAPLRAARAGVRQEAARLYTEGAWGLQHLVHALVGRADAERRPALLESLVVTGRASLLPGLEAGLAAALQALLPVSEYAADLQSPKLAFRRVPEYYPEVWERASPVAAWFGAGITAKMVFPDPKAFYTREEYGQQGGAQLLATKPL